MKSIASQIKISFSTFLMLLFVERPSYALSFDRFVLKSNTKLSLKSDKRPRTATFRRVLIVDFASFSFLTVLSFRIALLFLHASVIRVSSLNAYGLSEHFFSSIDSKGVIDWCSPKKIPIPSSRIHTHKHTPHMLAHIAFLQLHTVSLNPLFGINPRIVCR